MKKVIASVLIAAMFFGCSSKESTDEAVVPKLVLEQSLEDLQLNDQFGKTHSIDNDTKMVIFAFSKDNGHDSNDFFDTQDSNYLNDRGVLFVADVSGAPSLIRSMFIMPGLEDFKHTVLVIDDDHKSASYKSGIDSEKIVVVSLQDKIITDIKYLNSVDELKTLLK